MRQGGRRLSLWAQWLLAGRDTGVPGRLGLCCSGAVLPPLGPAPLGSTAACCPAGPAAYLCIRCTATAAAAASADVGAKASTLQRGALTCIRRSKAEAKAPPAAGPPLLKAGLPDPTPGPGAVAQRNPGRPSLKRPHSTSPVRLKSAAGSSSSSSSKRREVTAAPVAVGKQEAGQGQGQRQGLGQEQSVRPTLRALSQLNLSVLQEYKKEALRALGTSALAESVDGSVAAANSAVNAETSFSTLGPGKLDLLPLPDNLADFAAAINARFSPEASPESFVKNLSARYLLRLQVEGASPRRPRKSLGTYLRRACARQTLHARGEALAGAVSRHRALLAADPLFGPPPPLSATGVVPSDWVPRLQLAALGLPEEVLARARARGRAGAAIAGCMPGAGYVGKAAVVSHVVRGSVGSVPTSTSTASSSDDNGVVSSSRSSSSRSSSSGHPFKASPGSLEGLVGLSEDAEAEAAVLKMLGRWRGPPEGEAGRRAAEAQAAAAGPGPDARFLAPNARSALALAEVLYPPGYGKTALAKNALVRLMAQHGEEDAAGLRMPLTRASSLLRSAMGGQWPRLPLLVNLIDGDPHFALVPRPLPWSDPLCRLLGGAAQGASREDDLLLAVDGMVRSERRLAGFRRLVKAAEAEAGVSEAAEASAVLADAVEGAGSSLEAQHAPGQVPRLQEPGLQRPVAAASGTGGLGPGAVVMGAATAQTAPSAATLAKRAVQELLNTWILPNKRPLGPEEVGAVLLGRRPDELRSELARLAAEQQEQQAPTSPQPPSATPATTTIPNAPTAKQAADIQPVPVPTPAGTPGSPPPSSLAATSLPKAISVSISPELEQQMPAPAPCAARPIGAGSTAGPTADTWSQCPPVTSPPASPPELPAWADGSRPVVPAAQPDCPQAPDTAEQTALRKRAYLARQQQRHQALLSLLRRAAEPRPGEASGPGGSHVEVRHRLLSGAFRGRRLASLLPALRQGGQGQQRQQEAAGSGVGLGGAGALSRGSGDGSITSGSDASCSSSSSSAGSPEGSMQVQREVAGHEGSTLKSADDEPGTVHMASLAPLSPTRPDGEAVLAAAERAAPAASQLTDEDGEAEGTAEGFAPGELLLLPSAAAAPGTGEGPYSTAGHLANEAAGAAPGGAQEMSLGVEHAADGAGGADPGLRVVLVQAPGSLAYHTMLNHLRAVEAVGLDVETSGGDEGRDSSFSGRSIALMQIAAPAVEDRFPLTVYLVDFEVARTPRQRVGLAAGLKPLLTSPQLLKVLHAPHMDVTLLRRQYGIAVHPVLDTQQVLAAAMAAWAGSPLLSRQLLAASPGLALLLQCAGLSHDTKEEFKSIYKTDPEFWRRRPLTAAMVQYAVQDVAHLLDAYRALLRDLLRTPAPFLQQPGSRPPPAAPSPEAPQDPVHLAELCEQQPAWHREAVRRQQQEVGRQQEEHQEEQVQGEQQEEEEQQQQQQEGR